MIPESFLLMLEASPQPGRAGDLREVAAQWFAARSPALQTPSPVSTHALDGTGTRAGLGPIANGVRTAGPDGSKVTPESPSGPAAGGAS